MAEKTTTKTFDFIASTFAILIMVFAGSLLLYLTVVMWRRILNM